MMRINIEMKMIIQRSLITGTLGPGARLQPGSLPGAAQGDLGLLLPVPGGVEHALPLPEPSVAETLVYEQFDAEHSNFRSYLPFYSQESAEGSDVDGWRYYQI